jgi:hypothetical protein
MGLRQIIRDAGRGAVAGVIGTVLMDGLRYWRYRRRGGEQDVLSWEFGSHPATWGEAPAPARTGRVLVKALLGRDVPVARAGLVGTVMHWGYGPGWGAQFGVLAAHSAVRPGVVSGAGFGALVWTSDYVTLPLLGVYEPIWRYKPGILRDDLTAHLVYGIGTGVALRVLRWSRGSAAEP